MTETCHLLLGVIFVSTAVLFYDKALSGALFNQLQQLFGGSPFRRFDRTSLVDRKRGHVELWGQVKERGPNTLYRGVVSVWRFPVPLHGISWPRDMIIQPPHDLFLREVFQIHPVIGPIEVFADHDWGRFFPGLQIDDNPRVIPGKVYDFSLYEFPQPSWAAPRFGELEGHSLKLTDIPSKSIVIRSFDEPALLCFVGAKGLQVISRSLGYDFRPNEFRDLLNCSPGHASI